MTKFKKYALEYYHKYPNNYCVMEWILWVVYRKFRDDTELVSLSKQLGKRILGESKDTIARMTARKVLAFISDEDEAQDYIDTFDEHILIRPNIIGRRKWDKGLFCEAHDYFDLEMVLIFQYMIGRASYCQDSPEKAIQWNRLLVDWLKTIGNGEVPDGWLGNYGVILMRLAAASFASGTKENGYLALEESLSVYEKWYKNEKGKRLSTGGLSLFGNVKIARTKYNSAVYLGDTCYPYCGIWETDVSVPLTTDSGWEWFDAVRKEDRFLKIVEKAVELEEKYEI